MVVENKKLEIIQSSIEIFANEGFDRPSMESIAKKVNVSKRTLYKHFPSKKDLLDDLVAYLIKVRSESQKVQVDTNLPIRAQIRVVVEQALKTQFDNYNVKLTRIIFSEYIKGDGFKDFKELVENTSPYKAWIKENQDKGIFTKEKTPEKLDHKLRQIIHGIIFFPFLFLNELHTEEDINIIIEAFYFYAKVDD